ncbi:DUF1657 domain-containing protein [Sutcliffiella deserti]|uniref:DUF1657 domain-containing protein n=1 Tax=Sutcliffiella deserti TaxID=2875501 RepID=UPI001CBC8EC8|nr:DUF1657 domain-containing protein [Sutcliffiella deserti]
MNDEKLLLTYNLASLKMIRSHLHVYAMEAEDEVSKQSYHESMMKIDEIVYQINRAIKNENQHSRGMC